jgi:hypothetical protein
MTSTRSNEAPDHSHDSSFGERRCWEFIDPYQKSAVCANRAADVTAPGEVM